eukprot:g910.t1
MFNIMGIFACLLTLGGFYFARGESTPTPEICVTYFNFTDQEASNTYFGVAKDDGTITMRGDLGYRYDPQGRIAVGASIFSQSVVDNKTAGEGFGCCDKVSLLTVEKNTGKWHIASIDSKGPFGPGSDQCGEYGCGILEFGGINDDENTAIVWIEPLLPPPPPTSEASRLRIPQPDPSLEGLSIGLFDLNAGSISSLRSFEVNLTDDSATAPFDGGMSSFDKKNSEFWFSCNPHGDIDVKALA